MKTLRRFLRRRRREFVGIGWTPAITLAVLATPFGVCHALAAFGILVK